LAPEKEESPFFGDIAVTRPYLFLTKMLTSYEDIDIANSNFESIKNDSLKKVESAIEMLETQTLMAQHIPAFLIMLQTFLILILIQRPLHDMISCSAQLISPPGELLSLRIKDLRSSPLEGLAGLLPRICCLRSYSNLVQV